MRCPRVQAMVNDPDPVIKRLEDDTNEGQPLLVLSEAVRFTMITVP